MGYTVAQVRVRLSYENDVVIMVTKLHPSWSHFTGASFASTSGGLTSAILEQLKLWDLKSWRRGQL
jgi:hypothetical protein